MAKTPDNHVLSSKLATSTPGTVPPAPPTSNEYPRMLVHKDSKPGNLILKEVKNAEEAAALGAEWGSLADLDIETAPAEQAPDAAPPAQAPHVKEPHAKESPDGD